MSSSGHPARVVPGSRFPANHSMKQVIDMHGIKKGGIAPQSGPDMYGIDKYLEFLASSSFNRPTPHIHWNIWEVWPR